MAHPGSSIDGLTPTERSLVVSMSTAGAAWRKCAHWIGGLTGHVGPTGIDEARGTLLDLERAPRNAALAAYAALARLAQDFFTRYPLVEGRGNFGAPDGGLPADHVYTECRASRFARSVYDRESGSFRVPLFLVNGARAPDRAFRLVPHNLADVAAAILARLQRPNIDREELARRMAGPDFPCGGGVRGAHALYLDGAACLEVRGATRIRRGEGPPPAPWAGAPLDRGLFLGPEPMRDPALRDWLDAARRSESVVVIEALPLDAAAETDAWLQRVSAAIEQGTLPGASYVRDGEPRTFEVVAEPGADPGALETALYESGLLEGAVEVAWGAPLDVLLDDFIAERTKSLIALGAAPDRAAARPVMAREIEAVVSEHGDARRTVIR